MHGEPERLFHLVVVEHRRHEARSPVPWILRVGRVAKVQNEQIADARGVLRDEGNEHKPAHFLGVEVIEMLLGSFETQSILQSTQEAGAFRSLRALRAYKLVDLAYQ